jgi:hypothetical protein
VTTSEWIKKELRVNFVKTSRAGRLAARAEPRAAHAAYRGRDQALHVELTNGAKVIIPVKLIPELKQSPVGDIRKIEVIGRGGGSIGRPWMSTSVSRGLWPRCLRARHSRPKSGASELSDHRSQWRRDSVANVSRRPGQVATHRARTQNPTPPL